MAYTCTSKYINRFDNFGRVIRQEWITGTTTLDHYTYTYDAAGNRLSRDNELNSALDEDYTYDGLSRLIDTDRGGSAYQDWQLDRSAPNLCRLLCVEDCLFHRAKIGETCALEIPA